jgi:hypothetical protein
MDKPQGMKKAKIREGAVRDPGIAIMAGVLPSVKQQELVERLTPSSNLF